MQRSRRALLAAAFVVALALALPGSAFAVSKGEVRGPDADERIVPGGVSAQTISEWEPDNNIDAATGVDLSAGASETIEGALTVGSDYDDVYAVFLTAGETVTFSLNAGMDTDFGLAIYSPGATDVYQDAPYAWVKPYYYGGPDTYPVYASFDVEESGWYFVNPYTWVDGESAADGGSGAYTLTMDVDRKATFTAGTVAFPTVSYNGTDTVHGAVTSYYDGVPAVTGNVMLSYSPNGSAYYSIGVQPLVDGLFSFGPWLFTEKGTFIATYLGDASNAPSVSAPFSVNVRPYLTTVSATRYSTRSYKLQGYLKPWHKAGSYPVRIYLWRYVSGKYKAYGYKNAKAYDYTKNGETYTRYYLAYKFPYTGKWRMQAYHGDAGHVATKTSYSYVTVR